jgi:hypothetical protein
MVQRIEQNGLAIFSHAGKLEDFGSFVAWVPERQLGVAVFVNAATPLAVGAGFRALSTFASLSENWQPPRVTAHPRPAYVGTYVDKVAGLRTLRVSLEGEQLVIDYVDGTPVALPFEFGFVFEPGVEQARYVVTAVGVGERLAAATQ